MTKYFTILCHTEWTLVSLMQFQLGH